MGGFSSVTGSQTIMFADNASFDGTTRGGAMSANGQLWIGSTAAPNVRLGTLATANTTGVFATGAGTITLNFNNGAANVGVGTSFLFITSGSSNTSLGTAPLFSLTSGSFNVAVGANSLTGISSGSFNTAAGYGAIRNYTGNGCTAFGYQALNLDVSGTNNTAVGFNSLQLCTSSQNTALGDTSLGSVTSGSSNIAVGYNAASAFTSTESSNITIGNVGVVGDANTIRIGTSGTGAGQQSSCLIAGISGVTVAGSVPVLIGTNGQLGTTLSSIRYKENVQNITTSNILRLNPVTFNYKSDESKELHVGLIAEEVDQVMPELVVRNGDGTIESVKYQELCTYLLVEIKKLYQEIQVLKRA